MTVFNKETLSGWGNIPASRSQVLYLESSKEQLPPVPDEKMLPRGLGRSYADQATNENNLVIKTERMNQFLSFDEEKGILQCEAGTSFEKIIHLLTPKGWFLMVTPGTKHITIGGAIANDVHGKAHHVDGCFITCVYQFTILLADGRVVIASREENADLFWANFGGLGLFGIILTATIQLRKIETTYFKQRAIATRHLDDMLKAIDDSDETYAYSVAWIDPLARGKQIGRGVLTVGNHASLEDLPPRLQKNPLRTMGRSFISVPFYLPGFVLNMATIRLLNTAIYWKQKSAAPITHYEGFFYPLDMINHWNRGYGKRGFIQYQFVLPLDKGKENITQILKAITEGDCLPFLNVLKKFGNAKGGLLSFPHEGYTFAIDFPITPGLKEFIKKLDRMVLDMGGRIYLGKDAYLDEATFKAMYPQYKEWLEVKRKYDPQDRFSSDLSRRIGLIP